MRASWRIMGYWKNVLLEQYEQGWDFTDKSVCSGCINDNALKAIVAEKEDDSLCCDFCCNVPAAPLDVLLGAFVDGLRNEYEDANDAVSWDSREGGYQWEPKWDTWDLIQEIQDSEEVFNSEELFNTVREAVHDITWVDHNFILRRRDTVLLESWNHFCEAVKHKTRFVLWLLASDDDREPGEVPPAKILDQVGPLIDRLDLVQELPAGYRFWRAQIHVEPEIEHSAARLGTVPRESVLHANRMSPAGIPMFYGSTDVDTAIREVACRLLADEGYVTWAQFELTTNLAVVDFMRLPEEPSMFDPELGSIRREIRFLNIFVEQLSDRVEPANEQNEQIDYVPTQIVTEYLLHIHGNGTRSRGLMYRSSLTGQPCVVLDVRNNHCIDSDVATTGTSAYLKLITDSVECRKITETDRSMLHSPNR